MRKFYKENRFVILLIAVFALGAVSFFWFGHEPEKNWEESWRELSSSLTAELIGAMIAVFVIDQFLRMHREQSFRVPRNLVLQRINSLSQETLFRPILKIPQPHLDDPINGVTFFDFQELVAQRDFVAAIDKLRDDVFISPHSLKHLETFNRVENVAADLSKKWVDLLNIFGQYLGPYEFAGVMNIVDKLETLVLECQTQIWIRERFGPTNDKEKVIDAIIVLDGEVFELLKSINS